MVGSKQAGVFFVMSLGISSSDIPTASRAAIFAMGKPVALLASAELRETRGFISMTTMRPFSGFTANYVRTARLDADFANNRSRSVAHALKFLVRQRLRGSHGNRIAGMHAHGVEIFDRADNHEVVAKIAHHLEFIFLPAEDGLFDERFVNRAHVQS